MFMQEVGTLAPCFACCLCPLRVFTPCALRPSFRARTAQLFNSLHPPRLQIWSRLTRQLIPAVSQQTELYTMLPVPNPFVVPGARFRESECLALQAETGLQALACMPGR